MRTKNCDVLVAGGGIAGISAALAAARNGADVILVEKQCVLGGLATSGLVTIYLPLCDGLGTQISYGIAEELFMLSIKHNIQDRNPEPWLQKADKAARKAVRFEVQFNPVYFMLEIEALLRREGVRVYYDTRLTNALTDEGQLCAVECEDEEGRIRIHCKAAVDATGSAVLFQRCDEETLLNTVGDSVAGWYYAVERAGLRLKMLGTLDIEEEEGQIEIGLGKSMKFTGDKAEEINKYLYCSHRETLKDLVHRKEFDPDFIEPASIAHMPQLRMIRRIKGHCVMQEKESSRGLSSSIGMVSDWRKRGPKFEVPFEALYGEINNLFAAGRIISCDSEMWDIMRVIPCCAVTGQASGTAAALAAFYGVKPDVINVQKALKDAGQRIHFQELE